jgi:hypothetical protein
MILKFSENSRRLRWSASLASEAVDVTPKRWHSTFCQRAW